MSVARNPARDPVALIRLSLLLTGIVVLAWTQADSDLWGHVRFGHDIVAARAVPRADAYSFTSDRPWINHEWLAEVAMYGAYRVAGAPGLILLKLALVLGLVGLVMARLRRSVTAPLGHDLLVAVLVAGILPRVVFVRPQLFSLLLFGILLAILSRADEGRWRPLLLVPLLMAFWVNVHGGWLVGLGTFCLWLSFRVLGPGLPRERRGFVLLVGCASVAATLANPYGVGMWRFLYETVGLSRPDIKDWLPLYRLPSGLPLLFWLPSVVAAALLVIRAGRRNVAAHVAIVAACAAGSFRVSRLDAFFAIAVVMLLGGAWTPTRPARAPARRRPATARWPVRAAAVTVIGASLLAVPATIAVQQRVWELNLGGAFLPEPQAAHFVLANHLEGRMITWYDYGEYAIWHFSPSIRVSLDGRRETVYSDATLRANFDFCGATAGALDYPVRVRADYVWLPNNQPVVSVLQRKGWRRVFAGPVSSIFARPDDRRAYARTVSSHSSTSFPGP